MPSPSIGNLNDSVSSKDLSLEPNVRRHPLPSWLSDFLEAHRIEQDHASETDWKDLPPHKDEAQVALDVNRSFAHLVTTKLPTTNQCLSEPSETTMSLAKEQPRTDKLPITEHQFAQLRDLLARTVTRILRSYPQLNYYQGYHDVISIIILTTIHYTTSLHSLKDFTCSVALENQIYDISVKISLSHLRDFMMPSINPTIDAIKIIPELIFTKGDPELGSLLGFGSQSNRGHCGGGGVPVWCLSSVITLLSHDLGHWELSVEVLKFSLVIGGLDGVLVLICELVQGRKAWFKRKLGDGNGDGEKEDLSHSLLSNFWSEITMVELQQAIERTQQFLNVEDNSQRFGALLMSLHSWRALGKHSCLTYDLFKSSGTPTSRSEINTVLSLQSEESLVPRPLPFSDSEDEQLQLNDKQNVKTFSKLAYLTKLLSTRSNSSDKNTEKTKATIVNDRRIMIKATIIVGVLGILINHYTNSSNGSGISHGISGGLGIMVNRWRELFN